MDNQFIIIEGKNHVICNEPKEILETLLDKNYLQMSKEEKRKVLDQKAMLNCIGTDLKCVKNVSPDTDLKNSIITKNETTYILSLLVQDKIAILENASNPFFTRDLNLKNLSGNYIIVNKFAGELLEKSLQNELNKNSKENNYNKNYN